MIGLVGEPFTPLSHAKRLTSVFAIVHLLLLSEIFNSWRKSIVAR